LYDEDDGLFAMKRLASDFVFYSEDHHLHHSFVHARVRVGYHSSSFAHIGEFAFYANYILYVVVEVCEFRRETELEVGPAEAG
jgi:hypothetical protein